VRHAGIILVALLGLFLIARSASAQVGDICPVGDCSSPGGTIPGDTGPPPPQVTFPSNPGSGIGGNQTGAPATGGTNGSGGTGNNNGAPGANVVAGNGAPQGQPGKSGVGTPGRSGNPSPTPSVRLPSPAGGRTIPSYPAGTGSKTVQVAGSAVLPFDVTESPFPSLEPSPEVSPSESPSPVDLAAGNVTTTVPDQTKATKSGSWLPLILIVGGIVLLVMFLRGRKKVNDRSRRNVSRVGGGSRYR
jgi:hypothetical protein